MASPNAAINIEWEPGTESSQIGCQTRNAFLAAQAKRFGVRKSPGAM